MPKITCVPCEVDYKIKKTGNIVIDMFGKPPQPYKIYNGDRWECPKCGHEIIAGFAHDPLGEHYQDGFAKLLAKVEKNTSTIKCYER